MGLLDAERAPLLVRHLWADGDPGPIVAALAQVPELVEPTLAFVGASLGPSDLACVTGSVFLAGELNGLVRS